MAHEIDFSTGLPAIAYRGDVPWHGYGQRVTEDMTLEQWQQAAGLNWEVVRKPIFMSFYRDLDEPTETPFIDARGKNYENYKRVPNRVALTRSDSRDVLSVVSDRFKVVQPKEVLEFFRDLIDREGFKMHTAGALRGGKRVWALAETGKEFRVRNDVVGAYLLLATSYDGTFSTTAQFTSVRVVCNNTLSFALDASSDSAGVARIPHNQDFNSVSVKTQLGLDAGWGAFRDNVLKLTEHKVTKREAVTFFLELLGVTEDEAADGKQLQTVKKLLSAYESGPGSNFYTAMDTAWGLVNAVTFFSDHMRRASNAGSRFDSASFGSGAKLKQNAFQKACAIAEAA